MRVGLELTFARELATAALLAIYPAILSTRSFVSSISIFLRSFVVERMAG